MKTYTDELTPIDSVTGVYGGANWPEREVCVCEEDVCMCACVCVCVCVWYVCVCVSNSVFM